MLKRKKNGQSETLGDGVKKCLKGQYHTERQVDGSLWFQTNDVQNTF